MREDVIGVPGAVDAASADVAAAGRLAEDVLSLRAGEIFSDDLGP
jgi:hypothetical protein